jgi:histidinol-phosphatase (PHP family)
MITTDLHVHPSPWSNGPGAFRSFARAALQNGVDILGFTEHGPSIHPDPRYRGLDEKEIESYVSEISKLRDELRGQIQIFCGLELDYHPDYLQRYERIRRDFTIDFFLGSVHIIDDWHLDTPDTILNSVYRHKTKEELYHLFYDRVAEAASTQLFDGLAHLDYIRRSLPHPPGQPPEYAGEIYDELTSVIAANNLTVEINTRGLSISTMLELYPTEPLLDRLCRAGVSFTLGSDAHIEERVGDELKEAAVLLRLKGQESVVYFKGHERLEVEI